MSDENLRIRLYRANGAAAARRRKQLNSVYSCELRAQKFDNSSSSG